MFLSRQFNETYITDINATYYDYLSFYFDYSSQLRDNLIYESSQDMSSDNPAFESISFTRKDAVDYSLNGYYESELYEKFELHEDPFNVIYEADLDMDGKPEYKQIIDVDKDGMADIVKYGTQVEGANLNSASSDASGGVGSEESELVWYAVIQNFEGYETVSVDKESEPEKRTEWFDAEDSLFNDLVDYQPDDYASSYSGDDEATEEQAQTDALTALYYPKNYWAQKSVKKNSTLTQLSRYSYYSVRYDADRDGFADKMISYEKNEYVTIYQSQTVAETIIAAKPQNWVTFLMEYMAKSLEALVLGADMERDSVFNEKLTKEMLESGDLSALGNPEVESFVRSTYMKFSEIAYSYYISSDEQETITVTDWEEGEITSVRTYAENFKMLESCTGAEYAYQVTSSETGQIIDISTNMELPITDPADQEWDVETWGVDNIPVMFDTMSEYTGDQLFTTNYFEETITISIPNRFSLYHDYGVVDYDDAEQFTEFKLTGILITPPDGMVYYTTNKEEFTSESEGKTHGKYFYYDQNEDGFYETVYVVTSGPIEGDSGNEVYPVISIGFNYDGKHEFAPYETYEEKTIRKGDFSKWRAQQRASQESDLWLQFHMSKKDSIAMLLPETETDGLVPKDSIFEVAKLVSRSNYNYRFPELFYEIRHREYFRAWKSFEGQIVEDTTQQVLMTTIAASASAPLQAIPIVGQILGAAVYFAIYSVMTKFFMDMKQHKSESLERAYTFRPVSAPLEPISLNERSETAINSWSENMPAAIEGHPQEYYTTITGETSDKQYTTLAIATPPNPDRFVGNPLYAFGSLLSFLWDNGLKAKESNPDTMTSLDFDHINLDYFLLNTELYSKNYDPRYSFSTGIKDEFYHEYSQLSIGSIVNKITKDSQGDLNSVKLICVDSTPQYVFADNMNDAYNIHDQVLYRPIVLSPERYHYLEDLGSLEGTLSLKVKSNYFDTGRSFLNPDLLNSVERETYGAKVSLLGGPFYYPVSSVVIKLSWNCLLIFRYALLWTFDGF